jgi:hypothetical protein
MEQIDRIGGSDYGELRGPSSAPVESPQESAIGAGDGAVEVREISFESALDMLGGSYAGNVPACS